ncbi:hypothetical protein KAR91_50295 [Candidatus Pacearchaeota archaeon]|nr:hypothetical protein [Candidatus Pacearchaeota archaeon]
MTDSCCDRCGGIEIEIVPTDRDGVSGQIEICRNCEAFVPWIEIQSTNSKLRAQLDGPYQKIVTESDLCLVAIGGTKAERTELIESVVAACNKIFKPKPLRMTPLSLGELGELRKDGEMGDHGLD